MAAGAQRSYWRLGRRGLHLMAASFSNFSEDPNRRKEKDMSKCFERFGQCAVDERSDIRVFVVASRISRRLSSGRPKAKPVG
jgi:hypothetical protein